MVLSFDACLRQHTASLRPQVGTAVLPRDVKATRKIAGAVGSAAMMSPVSPRPVLSAEARRHRARVAALVKHSRCTGAEATAAARHAATLARIGRQLDPEGELTEDERRRRAGYVLRARDELEAFERSKAAAADEATSGPDLPAPVVDVHLSAGQGPLTSSLWRGVQKEAAGGGAIPPAATQEVRRVCSTAASG
jgi:hypothetical protein